MNSLQARHYRRLLKDSFFEYPFGSRERSITTCATSVIAAVFVFSLIISFFNCFRRRSNPSSSLKLPTSTGGSQLATMPVFIYGDSSYAYTSSFESENCAICLAEFEYGDEVRVLPICEHAFHKDCIDQWVPLRSLLCPVCRGRTMVGEMKPTRRPHCTNDWARDRALVSALGLGRDIPAPSQL